MPRYDIRSSQLGLLSGIRQNHTDMVSISEPAALFAPEARKGQLYIIAEAEGDMSRGRDACQLVLRTIRKVFYDDSSYSVTSALRKAIVAANKALYEHNFNASAQKRAFVGITCVVIKDNDLYAAQVRPAQFYLWAEGKLRSLPEHVSSTGPSSPSMPLLKPNAVGSSLTIEPDFYRAVLKPNDTVILCSSNLGKYINQVEAEHLAHQATTDAMIEQLATLCKAFDQQDAHALAIRINPAISPAAQAAPLSRAGVSEHGKVAARSIGDWFRNLTTEIALLMRGTNSREQAQKKELRREQQKVEKTQLTQVPDEVNLNPDPIPIPIPRPLNLGETLEERAQAELQAKRPRLGMPAPRPAEDEIIPPSATLGEGDYHTSENNGTKRIDLSDTPSMAALGQRSSGPRKIKSPVDMSFGERLMQPLEKLDERLRMAQHRKRVSKLPRPNMPLPTRSGELTYSKHRPSNIPWLWVLILVLLVTSLIFYGRYINSRNAMEAAGETLDLAEQAMADVRAANDTADAKIRLAAAEEIIAQIRSSTTITTTQENRLRYEQLEQEYERALSSIHKLSYFDDLEVFATHPIEGGQFSSLVVPPPVQSITSTADFNSIYLLDSNIGMIYRMPKNGGPLEQYLRPDDQVNGINVGTIRAQAWRFGNLVAVAQNGEGGAFTFFFPNNGEWSYSNLAGSSEWGRVGQRFRAINYDGNLYIWGASPDQILKYTSGNYGNFPEPWIMDNGGKRVDSALDMAIDGEIYLLQPDGTVLVFARGAFVREITLTDVEPQLITPASFFVTGETPEQGSIYLVDPNNGRIIQIDKQTGIFIQQIRTRPDSEIYLDQLTGVYVDESLGRTMLYLINGDEIVRATLPAPPQPFRANDAPQPTSRPISQ